MGAAAKVIEFKKQADVDREQRSSKQWNERKQKLDEKYRKKKMRDGAKGGAHLEDELPGATRDEDGNLKISTEYSDELTKLSDIDLDAVQTNLDLLRQLRRTLLDTLATARGAFKAKPTQANIYAISRLIADVQSVTEAIEDAIDYEEIIAVLFNEIVKPFIERDLLDLGSFINEALSQHGTTPKKRKQLNEVLTSVYRSYGKKLETKLPAFEKKVASYLYKATK